MPKKPVTKPPRTPSSTTPPPTTTPPTTKSPTSKSPAAKSPAAKSPKSKASAPATMPPLRAHPHLFQINTWVWLDQLSAEAGRMLHLGDVPDEAWQRIAAQGFDIVYLLGIWRRSLGGRYCFRTDPKAFAVFDHALPGWTIENVIGSPFSIAEYTPDPRIGDWAAIDAVRAKLHALGVRLILDFVPNHTGPDSEWVRHHPDYLVQGTEADYHQDPSAFILVEPPGAAPIYIARGRDPYFAPWTDTAQINYFSLPAREALVAQLQTIGAHCDGLRCDMAMLVLNDVFARTWGGILRDQPVPETEFWPAAIAALPADFVWMAECYWDLEGRLIELGFGFTYDKRLYDRLHQGGTHDVRGHLTAPAAYQAHMARFLENHDEPRSVPTYGRDRVPALAAMIVTLPGLRFFHQGQFEGRTIHVPMPLNKAADEPVDTALVALYDKILAIGGDAGFHTGVWSLLGVEGADDDTSYALIAYRWKGPDGYRLVVVNLAGHFAQGRLRIAGDLPPAERYDFADRISGETYPRATAELADWGLFVRLAPNTAHVFVVEAK